MMIHALRHVISSNKVLCIRCWRMFGSLMEAQATRCG